MDGASMGHGDSMSALRISAVTVTPVAFADPPLLNSVGVHEPFALRAVVEVRTDDGLSGLGETYADERHLAALRAAAGAIVGADAYHTEQIYRRVQAIAAPDTPIASGLIGRQFGHRPRVLPVRGRLPGHPGPGRRAASGRPARRRGPGRGAVLRLPVLQVGRRTRAPSRTTGARRSTPTASWPRPGAWSASTGSPRSSSRAACSRRIRRPRRSGRCAWPSRIIRCGWTRTPRGPWTPRSQVARDLDGVLEYLEDPTAGHRRHGRGGARSRRCRSPPTCASWPSPTSRRPSGRTRSRWCCPTTTTGAACAGPAAARRDLRDVRARPVHALQLAPGHQPGRHGPPRRRHPEPDLRLRHPLAVEDRGRGRRASRSGFHGGALPRPGRRPGLGVELDRDALARLHEQYLRCGLRNRDDTGYMRRVVPGYERKQPRW